MGITNKDQSWQDTVVPPVPTAGAREDVAALYEQHAERISRQIESQLRPEDIGAAEDLTHDVWLEFWGLAVEDLIVADLDLLEHLADLRVHAFNNSTEGAFHQEWVRDGLAAFDASLDEMVALGAGEAVAA